MKNNKNAPAGSARPRGTSPLIASLSPKRKNKLHRIRRYETTICAILDACFALRGSAASPLNILLIIDTMSRKFTTNQIRMVLVAHEGQRAGENWREQYNMNARNGAINTKTLPRKAPFLYFGFIERQYTLH